MFWHILVTQNMEVYWNMSHYFSLQYCMNYITSIMQASVIVFLHRMVKYIMQTDTIQQVTCNTKL